MTLWCLVPWCLAAPCVQSCDSAAVTPGDLEAAYADAVRQERSSVHLLRLTQKTGPVWSQLSTQTCHALLEVFIKHVRVSRAGGTGCGEVTVGQGRGADHASLESVGSLRAVQVGVTGAVYVRPVNQAHPQPGVGGLVVTCASCM